MTRGNISTELGRGTYVAHRGWRNGADCDGRARRRCRRCGGVQYDWGVGVSLRGGKRKPWGMHWYCNGRDACGLSEHEVMSDARMMELRQRPTKIGRAPGAPWKRWRLMKARRV